MAGKMDPQMKFERAQKRAELRAQLEELGAKTKKARKKKYKRKYTSRARGKPMFTSMGQLTQGLGAYTAPKSARFGQRLAEFGAGMLPGPYKALSPLAGKFGGWLGNKIGTIFGLGEYQVTQNTLIGEGQSPPMVGSEDDMIIVRHREYLGDIFSSEHEGAFKVQTYALQPGLDTVFEWLAPIAAQYQEWIPNGILFEFKSNSGEVVAGATNALGQIIMSTDYNSFNTNPFANKAQMQNTVYSTNAKITQSFLHPIECAPRRNVFERLFVRAGPVPPGQPPQLYDLGTFAIASQGCQGSNQNLGELWVTYEIGLSKASLIQTNANAVQSDYFISNSAELDPTTGAGFEGMVPSPQNSLGCTFDATGTHCQFPALLEQGRYQVVYYIVTNDGAPIEVDHYLTFKGTNCKVVQFWGLNGAEEKIQGSIQGSVGADNNCFMICFFIDVEANNAYFAIDDSVGFTAPPAQQYVAEMTITKVNMELKNPDINAV